MTAFVMRLLWWVIGRLDRVLSAVFLALVIACGPTPCVESDAGHEPEVDAGCPVNQAATCFAPMTFECDECTNRMMWCDAAGVWTPNGMPCQ